MTSDLTARRFFLFLLIATTVLVGAVIQPIASSLLVAAVLAAVLRPVHGRLARYTRSRAAAVLLVLGTVILLLGPVAGLSAFVVNEASQGVKFVTDIVHGERMIRLLERLPEPLRDATTDALAHLPQAQGARAAAAGWAAVIATGQFFFHAALTLIALFFLLIQGEAFVLWLDRVLPLRPGQTRELLAEFKRVSYAVVASGLITAAVQAVVALVGYYIASVPHPVFFGVVTFFCAIIPAIGAAGVCLLAALILLVTGHPYMALVLSIWGLAVVGLVDNVVKPLILKGGMQMPGAVVFFALLGGLAAFGVIGLLLGPLVVSLFVALLRMYERDFSSKNGAAASSPA
jgi:predicted PurR-regulated permease PerM